MKISKYLHSCLLFEQDGHKLLFDPGLFTFLEDRVRPDQFADVNTIVITHEHVDHLHVKALKEILALSKARLISNRGVAAVLRPEGLEVELHEEGTLEAGPFTLQALETAHQPILIPGPVHTSWLIDGRVLNPGDSFDAKLLTWKGIDTLILPITAPFLTEVEAVAFARRMEPKQVLPFVDEMRFDAVLFNLRVIGEAVKKLPLDLRERHADITWREIAGLRDFVAHAYFALDLDILWDAIRQDVPILLSRVQEILAQEM